MKIKKLVFCLIIVLSSFVILIAQDTDKTRLNGHIMDTTGASAPGIKIKIQDKVGKTFETLTDAEGFYSIKLPTGNYLIEIVSSGGLFGIKVENYKTAPTKMTLDIVLEIDRNAPTTNSPVWQKEKRSHNGTISFLKQ
jgi:phosphatidate phosphatase APP1